MQGNISLIESQQQFHMNNLSNGINYNSSKVDLFTIFYHDDIDNSFCANLNLMGLYFFNSFEFYNAASSIKKQINKALKQRMTSYCLNFIPLQFQFKKKKKNTTCTAVAATLAITTLKIKINQLQAQITIHSREFKHKNLYCQQYKVVHCSLNALYKRKLDQ